MIENDSTSKRPIFRSRFLAVQALYTFEITKRTIEIISEEALASFCDDEKEMDERHFVDLINLASKSTEEIDGIIKPFLREKWSLNRLSLVVKAILRVGISEITKKGYDDISSLINHYLQIAKLLNHSEEVGFINSILDKVAKAELST